MACCMCFILLSVVRGNEWNTFHESLLEMPILQTWPTFGSHGVRLKVKRERCPAFQTTMGKGSILSRTLPY